MHTRAHIYSLVAACIALVLLAAFPASVSGTAVIHNSHREASLGEPPYGDSRTSGDAFPFLRWLRDSAVELVFGRPENSGRGKGGATSYGGAMRARFRDDVVVRFNVSGPEQEGALSDAVATLILDVWAFTDEYVDIRLRKETVAPLLTLLPSDMRPVVLIPDVAAAVWRTFPSRPEDEMMREFDWVYPAKPVKPVKKKASRDGLDNIFFRDYQPLSVGSLRHTPRQGGKINQAFYFRSSQAGCSYSRPCFPPTSR
jgi:extracellular matrix protein 14